MPGSPKKRARREALQAAGATTQPEETEEAYRPRGTRAKKYEVVVEVVDGEEVPKVVEKIDKRFGSKNGASKERMDELRRIRDAMVAAGDKDAAGGRPRTKFSRAEITERALERLEPKALKVLADQVSDKDLDPSDRRAAAIKILEYRRGKPTQAVKVEGNQVTTIRFETAAWVPGMAGASAASIETGETLELPPGMVEELGDDEQD